MRKRPKACWVQSKECLTDHGRWISATQKKWAPDALVAQGLFVPYLRAGTLYRPDHPHWGVVFLNPSPPHTIKYYTTKAAAKAAATLSL